ncbi:threonine-tRNA ligase mitochondrial-like, partial [Trifolium pratense]
DDAHIFCRESQIKDEVKKALNFIDDVYQIFGFTYELKLSTIDSNQNTSARAAIMAEDRSEIVSFTATHGIASLSQVDFHESYVAFAATLCPLTLFGFTPKSPRTAGPAKCLVDIEKWEMAENALREALDEFGKPWQVNKDDGAFYGPKIDIGVYDSLNRKFQCGTLQLDFLLPNRFKLEFSTEDEAKIERPVMIHRSILGSVESMFAILLEHYKGKWPFWLSPRQAIVCPVSEKSHAYAMQVRDQIHLAGYQVDAITTDMKIQKKVSQPFSGNTFLFSTLLL